MSFGSEARMKESLKYSGMSYNTHDTRGDIPGTLSYEPRCEKTGLRGFRPGPTQTGLYSHRKWLES